MYTNIYSCTLHNSQGWKQSKSPQQRNRSIKHGISTQTLTEGAGQKAVPHPAEVIQTCRGRPSFKEEMQALEGQRHPQVTQLAWNTTGPKSQHLSFENSFPLLPVGSKQLDLQSSHHEEKQAMLKSRSSWSWTYICSLKKHAPPKS